MASLRDIRKRIRSVKNTEKITRAMKMVAAAKLRRAQDEVRGARPFAEKLSEVVARLAKRLELQGQVPHPLLVNRSVKKKVEVIVLTSDRGLCGAFNSEVIRRTKRFIFDLKLEHSEEAVQLSTIGRKGYDTFRREVTPIRMNYLDVLNKVHFGKSAHIAHEICESYISGDVDAVYLVYNEAKSAMSQKAVVKQLLPIVPIELDAEESPVDYLYEPTQSELLDQLLPKYLATTMFQAVLESVSAEHGARMTAMDNATRNAKEMTGKLTLQYNRARQAAITKELMEIIGGAEAIA